MLKKKVSIRDIFDALKDSENTMIKSYKLYDDVAKQDVLFDLMYELMQNLQYHVAEKDGIDLLEDYRLYKEGQDGSY